MILSIFSLINLNAFELNIDMGAGTYYTGMRGKLIYQKEFWKDSTAAIDHEQATSFYLWSNIEIDKRYWPNIRLEYSHINSIGKSFIHINTSSDAINQLIQAIEEKLAPLDITINNKYYDSRLLQETYEAYLYYDYFKQNNIALLSLGIGFRRFDFAYNATLINGLDFTDSGGDTIPVLFLKSHYGLKKESDGSQLSFEVDAKGFYYGQSQLYESAFKIDFLMPYNTSTTLGFEFGYKYSYINIQGEQADTVAGNMKTSGFMVGLVGHFQ